MFAIIKGYIAYIKDNPEGFWFKRKAYGYGWTPATIEGWLVTLGSFLFILGIVLRADRLEIKESEALIQVVIPMFTVIGFLILICLKTGESPKWQWKLPKKYFEDTKD